MIKKEIIVCLIIIVLASIGSFYLGKNSGKQSNNPMARFGQGQARNGARAIGGGGTLNGEIISQDSKSLTVKLRDGGSKISFLSASTTVSKMTTGSINDLQVGTQVMIIGKANTDGSINADSIQIRPQAPFSSIKL